MKLAPRDAGRFLDRPDPKVPGLLIYGADPLKVEERRKRVVRAQIGPQGEADMRLDRLDGAALRKDPALAIDALKARGFFDGPRAVVVDEANDAAAPALEAALQAWAPGDALLVATGGELRGTSKLRKLFEGHRQALCLAVYDDPPGQDEIERWLADEGLTGLRPEVLRELTALGQALDSGEFRQTLTRIALYKHGDPAPLSPEEISLLAPAAPEAEVDALIGAVAEGARGKIAPLVSRLTGQGVNPVTICIGVQRHLRMLHRLMADPAGPEQAVERMRLPFARKDRMLRQARLWRSERLDEALSEALALDFALRSSAPVPARALTERALIRLASLAQRG